MLCERRARKRDHCTQSLEPGIGLANHHCSMNVRWHTTALNSGFQGLSAVVSFAGTPLAQHGWCFGALAGVALLLAAFAYRRSVPGHVMSEGQMVALTAADEHA